MTTAQETLNGIQLNARKILSTDNLLNAEYLLKVCEATGIDSSVFIGEEHDPNLNFLAKYIELGKQLEAFVDNFYNDEVEESIDDFGLYLNQAMFALLFHEANDPLAIYEDSETKKMAMETVNILCSISELKPWVAQAMFNTFGTLRNLTYQLYEAEVKGEDIPTIGAITIQNFYDGLGKILKDEDPLKLLITNAMCYVVGAVGRLLHIGREKPVHEQIQAEFRVDEDATPPTLIEAFKKKYRLYVGSYSKLLQCVNGEVNQIIFQSCEWRNGFIVLQIENDIVVVKNPLDMESNQVMTLSKAFLPYVKETGSKIGVTAFAIF